MKDGIKPTRLLLEPANRANAIHEPPVFAQQLANFRKPQVVRGTVHITLFRRRQAQQLRGRRGHRA